MKRIIMLIFTLVVLLMLSAQAAPEEFLLGKVDEVQFDSALKFYGNHGMELRSICEKMIESHIHKLTLVQPQNELQAVEVLQKDFRNSEYKKTDVPEFYVLQNYAIGRCCADEHIVARDFELSNDAIIISFDDYYHRLDYFNTVENGLYYVSCHCCSDVSLEECMKKHLDSQYWDSVWNRGVEYQLIQLENGFIYYRWLI